VNIERKPVAFGDLRGWIKALQAAGEITQIGAEVDWNVELGTIMRLAQGAGDGPALLFDNIKDYNRKDSRCRRVFGCGLSSYRRICMMLGLPKDAHPRELVKLGRSLLNERVAPKVVESGPVKENILKGDAVDLLSFPVPFWNRVDGGRYILTYAGIVSQDPVTGVPNVGIYRGMVAGPRSIPILMWRAQHIGQHVTAWQQMGKKEMPIACVIGWDFAPDSPYPRVSANTT
jgi:4-hydroxy-3-polyprenylbenzoate decarboxylase